MNTKYLKFLMIVTKILRGLCIGFMIASVFLLVVAWILPEKFYSTYLINFSGTSLTVGNLSLYLTQEIIPDGPFRLPLSIILVNTIISLALSAYALTVLKNILTSFSSGEPFRESVSKSLKKLALISLLIILIIPLLHSLQATMILRLYPISTIFNTEEISRYTINYTVDITLLIIPAFLYVLSNVFSYGSELQELYDETV